MERANLYLFGDAHVATTQLRSFTEGTISFASRTNGLEGLTNFSGSITAYETRLDLTNFTTLYGTNGHLSFYVSQGSVINLSRLTNVVLSTYFTLAARADGGSRVDLSRLKNPDGPLSVRAEGAGSLVDLSALVGLWQNGGALTAYDQGTVLIPNVTAMRTIALDLRGDAVVPTTQLRSYTDGYLTLTGRTNGFGGLTNFTGALYVSDTHLDLSQITHLAVTNPSYLNFTATQGSQVDGSVYVDASGAGSLIDLFGFNGLWSGASTLRAYDGGTVVIPNVTAMAGMTLEVSDSASVNLAQLSSFTAGAITVTRRTNDFIGLTNFTGSIAAYDSRLNLTNFTTLYVTNQVAISAVQGALVDLSNVTNIIGNGYGLYLYAYGGGNIDLRRLHMPDTPLYVDARQANSRVDLSGFNGAWSSPGSLVAWSSATVWIPNVTSMRTITLDLRDDSVVPLAQLTSFVEGTMQLISQTNVFAAMTNFSGTLNVAYSRAEFPSLTQLNATNYSCSFSAGEGMIDLSSVSNVVVEPAYGFYLRATERGRIDLSRLESIQGGTLDVLATGEDSVVDLSSLTGCFSSNNAGTLGTMSGGSVLLTPNALLLAGVAIDFQSNPGVLLPSFLAASSALILYAHPWRSYRVEARDPGDQASSWRLYRRVAMTEALQTVGSSPPDGLALRVYEFIANPPELEMGRPALGSAQLVLFGVPNVGYQIETKTSLTTGNWENGPSRTLTNSFFIFPSIAATNSARLFRARQL